MKRYARFLVLIFCVPVTLVSLQACDESPTSPPPAEEKDDPDEDEKENEARIRSDRVEMLATTTEGHGRVPFLLVT